MYKKVTIGAILLLSVFALIVPFLAWFMRDYDGNTILKIHSYKEEVGLSGSIDKYIDFAYIAMILSTVAFSFPLMVFYNFYFKKDAFSGILTKDLIIICFILVIITGMNIALLVVQNNLFDAQWVAKHLL